MSDISASGRSSLTNNLQTNSRPKFQPLRVKELLHFCETDDDESEDKTQESCSESDSDDPQLLPQDECPEIDLNNSLSLSNATCNNELEEISKVPHVINFSSSEESKSISRITECKQKSESSSRNKNTSEVLDHVQPNVENYTEEKICQTEHKNNQISSTEQSNRDQLNDIEFQQSSSNININRESKGFNLQNENIRKEAVELRSTTNEEKVYENVPSINKLLPSSTGTLINSGNQWVLETPLKYRVNSMSHPDPCFSRRNITKTPQNKVFDASKNHGLTPSTIISHWPQNNVKQTPLTNKSNSFKDFIQTPKNSTYYTPNLRRDETPRYLNTEVRRPLADTGLLTQNDGSNRPLFKGTQLARVNEAIPTIQNKALCKNLYETNLPKLIFETPQTVVHQKSDVNEQLKENKLPNVENTIFNKETINKVLNTKPAAHCSNDKQDVLKPKCSNPQNIYSEASNQRQQQETESNVQFSLPSNISKPRQTNTLFVKGKEYLILGKLGQGMSGEVLRVQDLSSLELCAIKCVNLNRMDKDLSQGCLEEISMLHKLQAPCVIKMFDYEVKFPMVYVVMEMGDIDLSRLLKTMLEEKEIPLTMILYYWTEMLTAVKHIHDNGVIHSDLKPANFLLVRGRLKLIDFGIASSMNADMTSVVKNSPIGTLNYISPEALMDIGGSSDSPTRDVKYKISFKSDVWSLGCILYSLVYGRTPFHHIRSQWAKVNAITDPKSKIPFPITMPSKNVNKTIPSPPVLIDVMRRCLQHDPKARPTVAELLEVEYVPTKQGHTSSELPEIPASILVKIKHSLSEEEWRQLTQVLENRL